MTIHPWEQAPTGQAAIAADRLVQALPRIASDRCFLRGPYMDDFDAFADLVTSDRGRYVSGPLTREGAWDDFIQLTASWILRGCGMWTVEHQDDKRILGFVLLGHETGDPEPELGFLFTAEAEGQGYAFEAAEKARNNAWNALSFDTLVSYIDPENTRAIALAQRLGATRDAAADHDGCQAWRYARPEYPL